MLLTYLLGVLVIFLLLDSIAQMDCKYRNPFGQGRLICLGLALIWPISIIGLIGYIVTVSIIIIFKNKRIKRNNENK